MKTLRIALATGVSLVALSVLRAESNFGRNWMANYYQNPRPTDFVDAVYSLDRAGYFDGAGQPDTAIGFFTVVFKQNPEQVEGWLKESSPFLPEQHRRILAAAAWLSGSPAGAKQLRELSNHVDGEMRAEVYHLLAMKPVPVSKVPVVSEAAMNLQWGAFLASDENRYILNVFAALGSNEPGLATSARFELAQKAAEYPRVIEVCREQLDRQPQPIRSEIEAAMNDAVVRKPGA